MAWYKATIEVQAIDFVPRYDIMIKDTKAPVECSPDAQTSALFRRYTVNTFFLTSARVAGHVTGYVATQIIKGIFVFAAIVGLISMGVGLGGCTGTFRDHSTSTPVFGPHGQMGHQVNKNVEYEGPMPLVVPVQTANWSYSYGAYNGGYYPGYYPNQNWMQWNTGCGGQVTYTLGGRDCNWAAMGLKGPPQCP